MANADRPSANSTTAQLDVSEVYFLVLKWLLSGPCQSAARALLQDVEQQGLLPPRYDIHGGSQAASYQSLQQRYNSTPANALVQLLQQALYKVHAAGHAGAQGLQTLLAEGPLAALPALATPQQPPVAAWVCNPARAIALPQRLLLQQGGLARGTNSCSMPQQLLSERYCHHATFRGHGFPVFALLFDKAGQRVITGADDANVKIWSLTTGLLLVTGRGHTGEISDLSLSADGSMVASGSVDGDIRVWSLQDENLGQNMAVLRGHTAPVTLIDFHPFIPSALLSASNDGTLRLWDAKDQHFAPLLLVPSENFGAFSAVLGRTGTAAAGAAAGGGGGGGRPLAAALAAAGTPAQAAAAVAARSEQQETKGVLWCSWSPDGSSIVAGSQDCCTYIWYWDVCKQQQQQHHHHNNKDNNSSSSVVVGTTAPAVQIAGAKQSQQPNDAPPAQQPVDTTSNLFANFRLQIEQKLEQLRQERQQQQQQQPSERRRSRRISSSSGQLLAQQNQQQNQQQHQQVAESGVQARQQTDLHMQSGVSHSQQQQQQCLSSADWPAPIELQRLTGHKNEVLHVEFSHSGAMLASASLDGSVRLWQQVRRAGRLRLAWEEACCPLMVVAAPAAATASSKSKPRRQQATSLVINWLVWACDDSQVLAAASDNNIRVWCPRTGALLRMLNGHTQQAHVLQMHPFNPHLAMSAGYDGQIILWNTAQGTIIKQFSSSDTAPLARGSWAPPVIQLCDGQFSPDGNSFIVADVAGQFSVYAMGPPPPLLLSAPYDQFFKKDYDGIMHDEAGFAAYLEPAAVPTYFLAKQQPLCDNQFKPYPDDFQEAYRAGRVLECVKAGGGGMSMRGTSMELPSSLVTWPPTVTAAAWKALEDRAAAAARQTRVASEETVRDTAERQALLEHSRLLAALARGMTLQEEEQRIQQLAAAAANRQQQQLNQLPQQQRQGQHGASALVAHAAAAVRMTDFVALSDDFEENEREIEDAGELAGSDSDYAEQAATDDSDWDDASDLEDEFDDDFDSAASEGRRQLQQRQAQRHSERQRQRRQRRAAAEADGMVLRSRRGVGGASAAEQDEDWGPRRNSRRSRSRRATPSENSAPQRPRRTSKRRRDSDEFDYNHADSASELQDDDEDAAQQEAEAEPQQHPAAAAGASERERRLQRRSVRQRIEAAAAAQGNADHAEQQQQQQQQYQQHEQEGGVAAHTIAEAAYAAAGQQHHQATPQAHRRATAAAQHREATTAEAAGAVTNLRRESSRGSCRPGRSYSCYAWLSEAAHNPNTYVPQLGDAVVYLWEGHQKYLEANSDRLTQRPWEVLSKGGPALQQLQWVLQLQVQQQQQLQWQQEWQQQAEMQYYAGHQVQQQQDQEQLNQQIPSGLQQLQQQFAQLHQLSQQPLLQGEPVAAGSGADSATLQLNIGQCGERTASVLPAAADAAVTPPDASTVDEAGAAGAGAVQLQVLQQAEAPRAAAAAAAAAAGHVQQAEVTGSAAAAAAVAGRAPQAEAGCPAAADNAQHPGNLQVDQAVVQDATDMHLSMGFGAASITPSAEPYLMRPAEACTIVGLEYGIQDDQTVAVLTLQLSHAAAAAATTAAAALALAGPGAIGAAGSSAGVGDQQNQQQGQQVPGLQTSGLYFQVLLPPPSSGHAEFLILQSRFEASAKQQWQIGDRVQNYQLEADHSEGGEWYVGTVVEDRRIARPNAEVTADPYGAGGLWERYRVRWDAEREAEATELSQQPARTTAAADVAITEGSIGGTAAAVVSGDDNSSAADEADSSWLSPWELYAADLSTEAVLAAEHSTQLTGEQVAVLLHALEQLMTRGKYRMFRAAPAPSDVYDTADGRHAYNRVIALPLGLETIQERLIRGYYRSMQPVLHDASLIASNAATFNGADSPLAAKAQELCEFIHAAAAAGANAPNLSQWLADRKERATAAAAAAAAGLMWDSMAPSAQQQQQWDAPEAWMRGRANRTEEEAAAADIQQRQQQATPQRSRRSAAQKAIRQFVSGYDEFDGESDPSDEDNPQQSEDEEDDATERKIRAAAARSRQTRRALRRQEPQHRRPQRQRQQRHRKQRAYREDYSTPETSEAEERDSLPPRRSSRLRKGQQHDESDSDSGTDGGKIGQHQQEQQRQLRSRRAAQKQQEQLQHDSYAEDAAAAQTAAAAWLQTDSHTFDVGACQQQQQHYQGGQWCEQQELQQLFNQQQQGQLACMNAGQVYSQQSCGGMSQQQQLDAAAGAALGIPAAAQAALAAAATTTAAAAAADQSCSARPAAGLLAAAPHAAEVTAAANCAAKPKLKLKLSRPTRHA